jgi:aspartyl-tRNA(Asn)/glutamyl-tRNA(Gln) amidotransferase subunit A
MPPGWKPNDQKRTAAAMTIRDLRARLDAGETTSSVLCEEALARIADPAGEGATTFTEVFAAGARAAAAAADTLRAAGFVASPLAGIPVSVKDLFDVAGSVTRAGSALLADAAPAASDAPVVARLRAAGAVIVGKTNMTEFAYSGLGINPHYGTPRNAFDRTTGRIPGGSSSGAAVSVTDGMAAVALGTDTGGSVRIPAALCGLVGFKPTARRVPTTGAYPLSFTLDSIGPLAGCVADCVTTDAILAGETTVPDAPPDVARVRFLAPTTIVHDDADAHVLASFERALAALRAAGAVVDVAPLPALERIDGVTRGGGFSAAEAYWWHRTMLTRDAARYDPQIALRITRGSTITAADYIDLQRARAAYIGALRAASAGYDALLWPTCAIVAPPIADLLADDERYARINLLLLRNTSLVNAADGCALSLPMHAPGTAPAGLMIVGMTGTDPRILAIGATVEGLLAPLTRAA